MEKHDAQWSRITSLKCGDLVKTSGSELTGLVVKGPYHSAGTVWYDIQIHSAYGHPIIFSETKTNLYNSMFVLGHKSHLKLDL